MAALRDPWQVGESPYDVLGVEPGAGQSEIISVFLQRSRAGTSSGRTWDAQKELRDPTARAFHDLFFYDVDALSPVAPVDAAALETDDGRRAFEQQLVEIQRARPFDAAATHALAVLHYWTARYVELHPDLRRGASARELWERVVGHFVLLAQLEPFWQRWAAGHPAANAGEVRKRFHEWLPSLFQSRANELRDAGAQGLAEEFDDHQLAIKLEDSIARALAALSQPLTVGDRQVRLACGPLLLEYMGWREEVLAQVRAAAALAQAWELHELAVALSPLRRVLELLREPGMTDAAFREFQRAPEAVRATPEGTYLLLPLATRRAGEHALAGDFAGAVEALEEVSRAQPDASTRAILAGPVDELLSRFGPSLPDDPDEAVHILERMLGIADSNRAKAMLAEARYRRARNHVATVSARGDPARLAEDQRGSLLEELHKALEDLAKAAPIYLEARRLHEDVSQRIHQWPRQCWFCKRRLSRADAAWVGLVHRGSETRRVDVARCRQCSARHRVAHDWGRLVGGVGLIPGILVGGGAGCDIVGSGMNEVSRYLAGALGAAAGVAVGGAAGFIAGSALGHLYRLMERVPPESFASQSPEYQAVRRDGWMPGPLPKS